MLGDTQKLKSALKKKDKEIKELKELLAEAEAELKEYTNADRMIRPRGSILESRLLNKVIKSTFFILFCFMIIIIGLYPWLFKDKILGEDSGSNKIQVNDTVQDTTTSPTEANNDIASPSEDNQADAVTPAEENASDNTATDTSRDIFQPAKKVEVASDLGWLNVRTEPNVETGQIIKKINSGETYEWLEKTDNNWYKIVIDDQGHTGYVSGEYLVEK